MLIAIQQIFKNDKDFSCYLSEIEQPLAYEIYDTDTKESKIMNVEDIDKSKVLGYYKDRIFLIDKDEFYLYQCLKFVGEVANRDYNDCNGKSITFEEMEFMDTSAEYELGFYCVRGLNKGRTILTYISDLLKSKQFRCLYQIEYNKLIVATWVWFFVFDIIDEPKFAKLLVLGG